jgi:hypothetical protein
MYVVSSRKSIHLLVSSGDFGGRWMTAASRRSKSHPPHPTTTSLAAQVSSSGGDSPDGEQWMSLRLRSKTAETLPKPTTALTTLVSATMLLVHMFYSSGIWRYKLNIVSDDFNQDQHIVKICVPIKVHNGIYSIAWSFLIVVCAGKFVAPIYNPIILYPSLQTTSVEFGETRQIF